MAAACSSGTGDSTTTSEPTTTIDATTSTTSTAPQTTTPSTTTTSTTSPPDQAFTEPVAVYRVVDVASDDVLNIRSGPGVSSPIVAEYAPDATSVLTTGQGVVTPTGATWVEVSEAGALGWVNKTFLELIDQTRAPFANHPCSVGPQSVGSLPSDWPAPAGESNADSILEAQQINGGGCERTVITLGTDFSFEDLADVQPADRVPGDVIGTNSPSPVVHVLIDMPTIFRAAPGGSGAVSAFIVRSVVGPADEFGQNGLLANVPTGSGVHNIFYLEDPARIVVDYWSIPSGNPIQIWSAGTGVVLLEPVDFADQIVAVEDGALFRGYSRGFEASLVGAVIEMATETPVEVTWTPAFGGTANTGELYITTVNDWTEAWGQFGFTVSGLSAGVYRLELSTDNAADSPDHMAMVFEFEVSG